MLLKFNHDLSQRLWSTYYGGNANEGNPNLFYYDHNIYITAISGSLNNISTIGCHQESLSGGGDSVLMKFDEAGVRQWGTYLGGTLYDNINDIDIKNDLIYVSGATSSATGIATIGVYQETLLGIQNGFFAQFTTAGVRNWGSYFGGSATEFASGIMVENDNSFFLAGVTSSTTGIATPFALQPNLSFGTPDAYPQHYNLFVARFDNTSMAVSAFDKNKIQLSPNPNDGDFTLQGSLDHEISNGSVAVYDVQGRTVFSEVLNVGQKDIHQEFHFVNRLSGGVYFVKVLDGEESLGSVKMVVR